MQAALPNGVLEARRARVATALSDMGAPSLLVSRLSNIRYLTGFTGSAGYLVIWPGVQAAQLTVDSRYRDQATLQTEGVDVVGDTTSTTLWPAVLSALRERSPDGCLVEAQHLSAGQYIDLQEQGLNVVATYDVVERLRAIKDAREIEYLRQAGEIADGVLQHLAAWLRPGLTEREVAGEVERHQRQIGASGSATEVIVASGERSALPHGRATGRVLSLGEPVMVDISPTVEGYRGDVTRTFHLGPPSDEFRRIYDLVAEAQRCAEGFLRPGVTANAVDDVARSLIGAGGHGAHFEHSLGHGVGLDIHERPLLSPHDKTVVEAGMVVTIEPGVYVPGFAGIRIENSVVVLEDGRQSLNGFTTELLAIPTK